MTTAPPGCLSARASRPLQVSACIVNRLCPLWGVHVTDFWDDSVSLGVREGQRGWAIIGVCLSLVGLKVLECVTDLHSDLVKKNKINLTAGDPLFYSKAHSWSCAGVVCMFLVASHPSSSWAVTPLHPLQVTGISCRFPECPPSDRSGQLPCLSVSHSTDLWHFWLSW